MSHAEHHEHHIVPLKLLWTVFAALVGLTVLTVLTAQFVDLGPLNFPLAMAIALTKVVLVATFFMALKWDNKVNVLILILGCVFVVVFLSFTLFDTAFRGDIGNVGKETIMDEERRNEELMMRERVLNGEVIEAPAEATQAADGGAESEEADH